jgi:hypothetical protein
MRRDESRRSLTRLAPTGSGGSAVARSGHSMSRAIGRLRGLVGAIVLNF